jgi:hypothetical protein
MNIASASPNISDEIWQAAEKGPSAALRCSRGAATYALSTPRASDRAAPCIWAFLSSLKEN